MLSVTWAGWQEDVSKYWFLSVGFLYRSTIPLPSVIEREVSRKGKEEAPSHGQAGSFRCISEGSLVWASVNWMEGLMVLVELN